MHPPVTAGRLHPAWPGTPRSRLPLLEDEGHRLTGAAAVMTTAAAEMVAEMAELARPSRQTVSQAGGLTGTSMVARGTKPSLSPLPMRNQTSLPPRFWPLV